MTVIKLTFIIVLKDYDQGVFNWFQGPAFHRFLPNNELDKIEKGLTSFDGQISFWFEQRGFVQDHFIKYDFDKKLIEKDLIPKQAILDGGYLFGKVTINDAPEILVQVLNDNKTGDPDYVTFGKKIVEEITEQTNDLINILKRIFKQYWIKNLDIWDSRTESLGHYCNLVLHMNYSIDEGKTWNRFLPNKENSTQVIKAIVNEDFSDFISKEDWNEIKDLFISDFKLSAASSFLMQAIATCDKGDLKKAFIESVTAIEAAIDHAIKNNPKITVQISNSVQSLKSLPLPSQFSIIALLTENVNSKDIENSIEAIKIRNRIVHEGYSPKGSDEILLKSLLSSISRIIKEQVIKFPSTRTGNAVMSAEHWEELTKKLNRAF